MGDPYRSPIWIIYLYDKFLFKFNAKVGKNQYHKYQDKYL